MHFHPDGISDEDREITTYIPITSENRGSNYEVELPPLPFLEERKKRGGLRVNTSMRGVQDLV